MALFRAMDKFPAHLRREMETILAFFRPPMNSRRREMFLNYDLLSKEVVSLMCLSYLSSEWYTYHKAEIPPCGLRFALQGAIYFEDDGIVIEGGDMKCSSKGDSTPLHTTKCFY